jgi:hypothetical protein
MSYRRKGTFYVRVPTVSGSVIRTTGTSDRATARAMERILEELGPRGLRAWDLLNPVVDGRRPTIRYAPEEVRAWEKAHRTHSVIDQPTPTPPTKKRRTRQ